MRTTILAAAALFVVLACAPVDREADGRATADPAVPSHVGDHAGHSHASHDHQADGDDVDGLPADEPADFSIYHAGSVWTDQHGEPRPLDALAGRTQVVGMVYTSCAYACPRMMLDMKRIEGEIAPELRDRVGTHSRRGR